MQKRKELKKLAQFIEYLLGRRPDEFGLIADEAGYFPLKTILKVLSEEAGWRHIRKGHFDELLLSFPAPPFEIAEGRIRALDREKMPIRCRAHDLPKLLYTGIRRRAYPHVAEKGVSPVGFTDVVLAADEAMALRIARRLDAQPVLLTVLCAACLKAGVIFFVAGEGLFTAARIPPDCFSGPPLPRETPAPPVKAKQPERPREPGSFILDPSRLDPAPRPTRKAPAGKTGLPGKGRKPRDKNRREPPPWRR